MAKTIPDDVAASLSFLESSANTAKPLDKIPAVPSIRKDITQQKAGIPDDVAASLAVLEGKPVPEFQPVDTGPTPRQVEADVLGLAIRKGIKSDTALAAHRRDVAARTGVNPGLVTPQVEDTAFYKEHDPEELIKNFPAVAKYLGVQGNAELVGKDIGHLKTLETFFRRAVQDPEIVAAKGFVAAAQSLVGIADLNPADLGGLGRTLEANGVDFNKISKVLTDLYTPEMQASIKGLQAGEGFLGTLKAAAQNPAAIGELIGTSLPSIYLSGALARGMMPALPAIAAVPIGEGLTMAGSSAEQIRAQDPNKDLDYKQALLAAGVGVAGAGISFLGVKFAQKIGIEDLDVAIATGQLSNTLQKSGMPPSVATRLIGGFVSEGAIEEMPQSIVEQIAQNVALSRPWDEGVPEAAALGLVTGGAMGAAVQAGVTTGRQGTVKDDPLRKATDAHLNDIGKAVSAEDQQAALQKWSEEIVNNKLRKESPSAFKEFIKTMADEHSGVKEVFIDAKHLEESLQQSGIKPEEFVKNMPEVARDLQTALATGGEVRIPIEDYATYLAGSKLEPMILNELRTTPEGMTYSESQTFFQQQKDIFAEKAKEIITSSQPVLTREEFAAKPQNEGKDYTEYLKAHENKVEAFARDAQEVHDKILTGMNSAKRFNRAVNVVYAVPFREFYAVNAAKEGILPSELYARLPLNFSKMQIEDGGLEQEDVTTLSQKEVERRLVAQHNISVNNLVHADRMGGLAAPSLAITDKDNVFSSFGDITLLSSRDMVDPKSGAKVFGADIYSPRYPQIDYSFSKESVTRLNADLKDALEATNATPFETYALNGNQSDVERTLKANAAVLYSFLQGKKVKPKLVKTKKSALPKWALKYADRPRYTYVDSEAYLNDIAAAPEYAEVFDHVKDDSPEEKARMVRSLANSKAYEIEAYRTNKPNFGKADPESSLREMTRQMQAKGLQPEYDAHLYRLAISLNPVEKIFKGFSPSGNRKYVPHNIENVIKEMKTEIRGGESFNYGLGSVRAKFTPQFKSIEQIRKANGKLLSSEAFELVKREVEKEFESLMDEMGQYYKHKASRDNFYVSESQALFDAPKLGIPRALKENQFENVPRETQERMGDFLSKLADMPTEYFEVKLLRRVGLNEFSGAVVPKDAGQQVIAILRKNGVKDIKFYKPRDNKDRLAKINEFSDLFFQRARTGRDADYLKAVADGDMVRAQEMVYEAAKDKGYISGNEYRMMHQAPNREDYNLATIKDAGIVPDDYWTHPHYYQNDATERNSFYTVEKAIESKSQKMWVYRSVPKDVKDTFIRNGDWVSPSREYAKLEGEGIPGGYRIIAQRVSLKDVWWDANSINELGYDDGKEYAYKNTKNNRKLLDAVTYDDEGNVVPLSKRFNSRAYDTFFQSAFYSALEREIPNLRKVAGKDGNIRPEQAKAWIEARQKEGKFKKEEIEAVGLMDWLDTQDGKVPVADIENFVRENGVQIEETLLSPENTLDEDQVFDTAYASFAEDNPQGDMSEEEYQDAWESEMDFYMTGARENLSNALSGGETKFNQYVLPGGENYRELLLTLPDNGGKEFTSAHFDQPNILAHVRVNERRVNGQRVLLVEEIQSDWAQQGRDKGFGERNVTRYEVLLNGEHWLDFNTKAEAEEASKAAKPTDKIEIQEVVTGRLRGTPAGPFVQNTKSWTALAVKRLMRYAAENGFDKIAWTTGEQQAARYDLSKQIAAVNYVHYPESNSYGLHFETIGSDRGIADRTVKSGELSDFVGKELAEKIVKGEGSTRKTELDNGDVITTKRLSGLALKIGGEGMKAFYDQIVPQVVNDVSKKLGGGKVGSVALISEQANQTEKDFLKWAETNQPGMPENVLRRMWQKGDADETVRKFKGENGAVAQHSLDITPEMRDKIMQGLPLFQGNRAGFNPNTFTMTLLDGSDLSSVIHEGGHFYLEALNEMATRPEAPQQIKDDFRKTLEWFGITGNEVGIPGGETLAQFAGIYSGTADKYALATAQQRISAGDNAETVRQETGWFKGVDGKWRYEIDDSDATLVNAPVAEAWPEYLKRSIRDRFKPLENGGEIKRFNHARKFERMIEDEYNTINAQHRRLPGVLRHPKLYAAYPQLLDYDVMLVPDMGKTASLDAAHKTIRIGDPSDIEAWKGVLLHEIQHGIQGIEDFARGGSPEAFAKGLPDGGYDNGYSTYRRLAGEVEARNTQGRMRLTGDERRLTGPSATQDTPDGEVLVTFNGEINESAPRPINATSTDGQLPPGRTPEEIWNNMTLDQKRPYHEQWAQSWERYALEGKAPTLEMQPVFARFRAWMLNIYKSMKEFLRNNPLAGKLNDDIRAVFDRLIASDEAISEAQKARSYAPLFATSEEAGVTDKQFQEYVDEGRRSADEATSELDARSIRDMKWLTGARTRALNSLQAEARTKRKMVRTEVEQDIVQEPVERAKSYFAKGEYTNDIGEVIEAEVKAKLNEAEVRELMPNIDMQKLRGMTSDDGIALDLAAQLTGFGSGEALLKALNDSEPTRDKVAAEVDKRMLEQYGDLVDDAALSAAADEAVHNEARARFMATGLKMLLKTSATSSQLVKAAKQAAEQAIAGKPIRDIRPGQYARAETKANKEALKRAPKDRAGAAEAQRAALLNNKLYSVARDAKNEVDSILKYVRKFDNRKLGKVIHHDYLEQIVDLLSPFEFKNLPLRQIDKNKSLAAWIGEQEANGFQPAIDVDTVEKSKLKNYKDMTLEELRGLKDTIKQIEHLGRYKDKLLTAKDRREFNERMLEAEDSIRDNANRTVEERATPTDTLGKMGQWFRQMTAGHRKFSSIIREMDGGKDNGTMWNLLSRAMNEAGDTETEMRQQAAEKVASLFKMIELDQGFMNLSAKKRLVPGTNISMTHEQRIMFAMNWGNDGNRQRLLDGGITGRRALSMPQAQSILDTLTKPEWDFVQATWDYVGTYKEQIAALERKMTGVEPLWIEPASVETKFGTYAGGYFPAKYDAELSTRSESLEAVTDMRMGMKGAFGAAATRNGYTQERSKQVIGRPLLLSFNVIPQHINEVIHRLSWQPWLTDANRILRHLDSPIREHYGTEILREMRDTVMDIATGDAPAKNATEAAINRLRIGSTIVGMGWRVTTALLQPSGLAQSYVRVGPKWVSQGILQFLTSPNGSAEFVDSRSTFMKHRGTTMNREINEVLNTLRTGEGVSNLTASYFWLIAKMQRTVDIPTWIGAYNKGLAEVSYENAADDAQRKTMEEHAVRLADQAVIDSQSSGMTKDLARVQRGSPLHKILTNFYSYFSATYNLNIESVRKTNFMKPAEVMLLANNLIVLNVVPVLLAVALKEATKGGCGDDLECIAGKLANEQISYLLGQMILLREIGAAAGVATGGDQYGYQGPAGLRFFGDLYKAGVQVNQGEADMPMFKSLNNVAGAVLHYPAGQINNTVEGIMAVENGDVEGASILPALLFGPPKD